MKIIDRVIRVPYVWETLRKAGLLKHYQKKNYEQLLQAKAQIDKRLQQKKLAGDPVNVLFICHRPQLWPALQNVYEALKADPVFHVQIVAVPQRNKIKGRGYNHNHYVSEGAEEFWKNEGCINGYDYRTGEWLDLRTLSPDYIFFQQPYNVARPDTYVSTEVARYAKLAYITYYVMVDLDARTEECTPVDFVKDLSFYFAQNEPDKTFMEGRLEKGGPNVCQIEVTGHPRLEHLEDHMQDTCDIWNRQDSFKVLWTPRWTTNEGNNHFFSYRKQLTDYCRAHKEMELIFRPHPQAFKEWRSTGEMTEKQEQECRQEFSRDGFHLDESKDFYPQMFTSNVLISDPSSMIIDYFYTGKPIIYCASNGVNDGVVDVLRPGLYWVNSWEEVKSVLDQLRKGDDPLKEIRAECARKYQGSDGQNVSRRIHDILREDALK